MSNRALRKLHPQTSDIVVPEPQASGSGSDTDDDEPCIGTTQKHRIANPFDLLNDDQQSASDDEELLDLNGDNQVPSAALELKVGTTSKSQKKKKKRKKKKQKDKESSELIETQNVEDEIDASIKEVNEILGTVGLEHGAGQEVCDVMPCTSGMRSVLTVEHKNLNPENEMRRRFGSRVVQGDPSRRRQTRKGMPKLWLTRPKDSWPPFGKTGLSMRLVETKGGYQYFKYDHNHQYQQVQVEFWDAVETYNPQNISSVLNAHPYHIDSLLQMSEVFRISEDAQMATELIERTLFAFERAFHPTFSLTTGTCRMEYKYPENRAFFLTLYRYLITVGQKGCYRTALEFCKLLLSLDPEGDPLCILLMIDFYALRSEEFSFLEELFHHWEAHKNLSQLPNFALSVPLAIFHQTSCEDERRKEAGRLLQQALLMFPSVLLPLLDKCSINPDSEVSSHKYFAQSSYTSQHAALNQLIALYIGRCFSCWKEPEVVTWLESNVQQLVNRINSNDPDIPVFAERRQSRYRGTPRNIYRHIIISEMKDATAELPREMANSPVLSYDPLPPTDSVESYTRPQRRRRIDQESNILTNLFRSLLPNFNIDEPPPEPAAAAAAGGNNLQQGVGALMEAMRDLLQNIQPVPAPVENQHNDEQNADEDEDEHLEEWD